MASIAQNPEQKNLIKRFNIACDKITYTTHIEKRLTMFSMPDSLPTQNKGNP